MGFVPHTRCSCGYVDKIVLDLFCGLPHACILRLPLFFLSRVYERLRRPLLFMSLICFLCVFYPLLFFNYFFHLSPFTSSGSTLRKVSAGGEVRQAIRWLLPHARKYQPATNHAQQVYRFAPLRLAALIISKFL